MWKLGNIELQSRLILGTANYPSLEILKRAILASKAQVITVSLKRENPSQNGGQSFWGEIKKLGCHILPNTAGCRTANEAIQVASMAREIFETNWIKLEVIGDDYLLQPNGFELVKAAEALVKMGFEVFPFCTEDFTVCKYLYEAGCKILMPWGAPIGSGKGLVNIFFLEILRERFPDTTLIIDAGIGNPLHAMQAMVLGYDGVLVNSAISQAIDPVRMAKAFKLAVESGVLSRQAGMMPQVNYAKMSTPLAQTLFWNEHA